MTPDDYLVGHVREALAADPDVQVRVVGGRLVLSGDVPSETRRDEVVATTKATCGAVEVVCDLVVRAYGAPRSREELR